MKKQIQHLFTVSPAESNQRLDQVLAQRIDDYSRAQIQNWIKNGCVSIDQSACHIPKTRLKDAQTIVLEATLSDHSQAEAEAIALDIIFEDDHLLILNKQAGLVVHPGAGNPSGTLLNALLHIHPSLSLLPRAGIVHRLDKDTTGIMMVAKTSQAYHQLTSALADRQVSRRYLAIVDGNLKSSLTINKPIGRHKLHRQKMAIHPCGKPAITHVTLKQRLQHYTFIEAALETGRTHQIRVHLQSIGHPLLGDHTYGHHRGYQKLPCQEATHVLSFSRQALHAYQLAFCHPVSKTPCRFNAPLPTDMQALIHTLQ